MHNTPRVAAVIPAAGNGSRMRLAAPKQYLQLAGKTVLEHSVAAMAADPRIQAIYIVTPAHDEQLEPLKFAVPCPVYFVTGGATRAASVFNGVRQAHQDGFDVVAVHDAARPCLQADELAQVINEGIAHADGALLALPVADTLKRADTLSESEPQKVLSSVSREQLWRALTPQVFRTEQLLTALTQLGVDNVAITDEASAIELVGGRPILVVGRQTNLKITQPGDEGIAELFLTAFKQERSCE